MHSWFAQAVEGVSNKAISIADSIGAKTDDISDGFRKSSIVGGDSSAINVVIVGAGPVGLYFAKELKKRDSKVGILIIDRFATYSRHHYIKIERHFLNTSTQAHAVFSNLKVYTPLALVPTSVISATKTMSIMDLEKLWREEAETLGVLFKVARVEDPISLEHEYPQANMFIGADGSKSVVRSKLFGNKKTLQTDLQYMVEFKYSVLRPEGSPGVQPLSKEDLHKTRKILNFHVNEFIRDSVEACESTCTVIVRLLVDKCTYETLPDCTFASPLYCPASYETLPEKLRHDIKVMVNVRKLVFRESCDVSSPATVTKTTLGLYKSSIVARYPSNLKTDIFYASAMNQKLVQAGLSDLNGATNTRAFWFLIGDAAMGVPFYRSLNAGLEAADGLIEALTPGKVNTDEKHHSHIHTHTH
jgi:hypothetical protein